MKRNTKTEGEVETRIRELLFAKKTKQVNLSAIALLIKKSPFLI